METPNQNSAPIAKTGMLLFVIALCGIAAIATFYFVREHQQALQLASTNQALTANLNQVQGQLQSLTDKLNTLTAAQQTPPAPSEPSAARLSAMSERPHKKPVHRTVVAKKQQPPPDDPRWGQVQSQLTDQQKQLAATREEMERNRSELDGRLNSTRDELNGTITHTRDELNGSIARTHEEVVALQKRGERNYYEFHLDKSKGFQRVGPLSVSLRKVNEKHKRYNLALIVDDMQVDKKNVNVLEPVWITLEDRPQPVQLVVNKVQKDRIEGYVSEPKYKNSELTASAAPAADKTQQAAQR
jgi:hypothetical protein